MLSLILRCFNVRKFISKMVILQIVIFTGEHDWIIKTKYKIMLLFNFKKQTEQAHSSLYHYHTKIAI